MTSLCKPRSRSIDHSDPDPHPSSTQKHHRAIHDLLFSHIHTLLRSSSPSPSSSPSSSGRNTPKQSTTRKRTSSLSSSELSINSFIQHYSPSLYSAPSSPTRSSSESESESESDSDSIHSIPCPIPAITLSAHSTQCVPSLQPNSTASHHPINMPTTSSLLPSKLGQLRSRFNKPINSTVVAKPKSPQANPRPAAICVSPPTVGLFIDPDSWVHSDDSDDDEDEEEDDDDKEQEKKGASDSLASSKEERCKNNDEMPLSQLWQSRNMKGSEADSTASGKRQEQALVAAQSGDTAKFPRVLHSPRSLRSLCGKKATAPPAPGVADRPRVHYQEASEIIGCTPPMTPKALSPSRFQPQQTLRSVMSSPNLSPRTHNLSHDPFFPAPHTARPGVSCFPSPFLLRHSPILHRLSPASQIASSDLHTPPASISPSTRSLKLSSPQSSVVSNPSSEPQDVFRRMRRRHKQEMHGLHHPHTHSPSRPSQPPSGCIPPLIDDSLYSLLTQAQRRALQQRSDFLSYSVKFQLEAFACEMIHANSLALKHPPHPHPLFFPYGVGAY